MPRCPQCGALARPNIMMFGDWEWVDVPYEEQGQRLTTWISSVSKPVVVEVGAEKALPTVRRFSERSARQRLIRINPREPNTTRCMVSNSRVGPPRHSSYSTWRLGDGASTCATGRLLNLSGAMYTLVRYAAKPNAVRCLTRPHNEHHHAVQVMLRATEYPLNLVYIGQ